MEKYLVNVYSIYRQANGYTFWMKSFSKVLNEKVVKFVKKANKKVGYKYAGRLKDIHGNYYTQYGRKSEELSTPECEVIYLVTITRLK